MVNLGALTYKNKCKNFAVRSEGAIKEFCKDLDQRVGKIKDKPK